MTLQDVEFSGRFIHTFVLYLLSLQEK